MEEFEREPVGGQAGGRELCLVNYRRIIAKL
jgi:hypothetical protein